MDLKKPMKGQKINYEEYEIPENKNQNQELPQKKDTPQQQQMAPSAQQNPQLNSKKDIQISQQTKERAEACKLYVESKQRKNFFFKIFMKENIQN